MRFFDIFSATYYRTFNKVSLKYFTKVGEGDNFPRLTLSKSQILESQFSRKSSETAISVHQSSVI